MKAQKLILRCFSEYKEEQWSAVCLDFCLAAQADTFEESQKKLEAMICEYVHDALVGEDSDYATDFLSRRAPMSQWAKYYTYFFIFKVGGMRKHVMRLFKEAVPLSPVNCNHA